MEPNTRQREAISSTQPNNVVIAGPGTGKSRVLLFRACHLIETGVQSKDIVLSSFTNASIRDLRASLESDEGYAPARECKMSTFHSLALRSLIRNDRESARVFIADDWEERFLIDPYLKSALGLRTVKQAAKRRRDFEARWCQADENPEEWLSQAERRQFLGAFQQVKDALNFTTRGELTYRWWQMLSNEPAASNADLAIDFRHLLVDEYQDLNECEHEILEKLGRRGIGIFVVGDPNQSIYQSMRHAHPELCDSFPQRFDQTGNVVLHETYRCPPKVLGDAAALMDGQVGDGGVPTTSHRSVRGEFRMVNFANQSAEATGVAVVAKALAESYPEDRVLILYPVKQVGLGVSNALTSLGQNHIFTGGRRPDWEPDEQRLAKALARLLGNVNDSLAAGTAIVLSGPKTRRAEVLQLLIAAHVDSNKTGSELLDNDTREIPAVLSNAVDRGQARLTELRELTIDDAIARLEAEFGVEGLDIYLLNAEQRRRLEQLAEYEDPQSTTDDSEDGKTQLEEIPPGITVTSYHSSKGMEADTVFLLAVEPDFFEDDERSSPNEKRRLLFVGITRSLNRLYASYAARRYGPGSYVSPGPHRNRRGPSDFISSLSERLEIYPQDGTSFVQSLTV